MKKLTFLILSLALLLTGCIRPKRLITDPLPPAPVTASTESAVPTPTHSPSAPNFAGMTFVEKNELCLKLLEENQAAGMDTSEAEETYVRSLEASLEGNSAEADRYLEQAILLLWDQ